MSGSYTPQQLQTMAQRALLAFERDEPAWTLLVMQLTLRGFTYEQINQGIKALARGEVPA